MVWCDLVLYGACSYGVVRYGELGCDVVCVSMVWCGVCFYRVVRCMFLWHGVKLALINKTNVKTCTGIILQHRVSVIYEAVCIAQIQYKRKKEQVLNVAAETSMSINQ